ncbi:hypothetical protein N7520_009804 [Penicillium odoratum]|uniref:uncharacterized protein n=1 Tax=Penicillium odoratum TaxID=1167516 RepID=UPI002548ACC1|nr:uncharacterized protein N7520_009804 [Penicillium odoratum]KAJ5752887.1 hypothetical protein N7520_009804 [Penicillium odoratum]
MPHQTTLTTLKTGLSKLAMLKSSQAAVPPILKGLPAMAIVAGGVIAQVTNGENFIERQILGKPSNDECIALPEPTKKKTKPIRD